MIEKMSVYERPLALAMGSYWTRCKARSRHCGRASRLGTGHSLVVLWKSPALAVGRMFTERLKRGGKPRHYRGTAGTMPGLLDS